MSFYRYGQFGILPEILAVMSKTGGSPPELFPGGPSFVGWDDAPIFYGTNTGFLQGAAAIGYRFTPPSDATVRRAASVWAQLQSASAADESYRTKTEAELNMYLRSFSNAVANHSGFGYSQDAQKRVVEYANQLKKLITAIGAYRVTAPAPMEETALVPDSASPAPDTSRSVNDNAAIFPSTTSGVLSSEVGQQGGSNTVIYIVVGGVVLAGLAALLLTRKKSSVAGYRRRRRR